jgi:hypothetical protein
VARRALNAVIAYRAMLDVPRELMTMLAGLLRAERRARGTRKQTRALTCWYHALLVLVWYRKREDMTVLAAGFRISRATAVGARPARSPPPRSCFATASTKAQPRSVPGPRRCRPVWSDSVRC